MTVTRQRPPRRCVSPVFGYLADRSNSRKCLVMFGLALWALASGASSFAPDYLSLLALRAAVGVGLGRLVALYHRSSTSYQSH